MAKKKKTFLNKYLFLKLAALLLVVLYLLDKWHSSDSNVGGVLKDLNQVSAIEIKDNYNQVNLKRDQNVWALDERLVEPITKVRSLLQLIHSIEYIGDMNDQDMFDSIYQLTGKQVILYLEDRHLQTYQFALFQNQPVMWFLGKGRYIKFSGYSYDQFEKYAQANAGFWLGKSLIKQAMVNWDSIQCTDFRSQSTFVLHKDRGRHKTYNLKKLENYFEHLKQVQYERKMSMGVSKGNAIYQIKIFLNNQVNTYYFNTIIHDGQQDFHRLLISHDNDEFLAKYVEIDPIMKPLTYFTENVE